MTAHTLRQITCTIRRWIAAIQWHPSYLSLTGSAFWHPFWGALIVILAFDDGLNISPLVVWTIGRLDNQPTSLTNEMHQVKSKEMCYRQTRT